MLVVFLCLCLAGSIGRSTGVGCYGDIKKVGTTGASCATARQDKLGYCGVRASQQMAATDLVKMNKFKAMMKAVGKKLCVDPALIAALASRESRAGSALRNGYGDGGNGFGLLQVDKRYHKPRGAWNSQEHITQAIEILVSMIKAISKKFPKWSVEQKLKGGIAAYNAGPGNVRNLNVDSYTTGKDYASDVVARAHYYSGKGY
ncbi:lysozyme g-like [Lissotriton helveticus]